MTQADPGLMQITCSISVARVRHLLHGHLGSFSPWLHSMSGTWTDSGIQVQFDLEAEPEGAGNGSMLITASDVEAGLGVMLQSYPQHFANFLQEMDDDITFDVAIQCIIFKKVIYG